MSKSKEEIAAYQREYRKTHKARLAEYDRERRIERREDPKFKAQERESHLRKRYGISSADYEAMLGEQRGVCALCYRPPGKIRLHTDHCHENRSRSRPSLSSVQLVAGQSRRGSGYY